MDQPQARTLVKETFENSYDQHRFIRFTKELLNTFQDAPFTYRGNYLPDAFESHVSSLERIGKYSSNGHEIDVLTVRLKKETALARARTMQRNFIAWYLKGSRGGKLKDAALVAFVSSNSQDWRFSLVKMDYRFVQGDDGRVKVEEDITPARRWSFLVGLNENSHTAQSRLAPLIADQQNPTLQDLEEAFNIERVTKEFFEKYRDLFLSTKVRMDELLSRNNKLAADFQTKGVNSVDFSKKLLGQIVFLYFLQKKGWFGVGRDANWGSGSRHFLRELFEHRHGNYHNFYNDILEPLFYEALRLDRGHDDHYYSRFNCRIPFLNGGLFDPIGDYDWVGADILLSNDLFSNAYSNRGGDTGTGILDVFDRYNFTVREDEPLEKEVAVDPELLGKAYEKFNAIRLDNFDEYQAALKSGKKGAETKFNREFGVYYTPREIVHYMCQQSLIQYLSTELDGNVPQEEVETFIQSAEMMAENDARVLSYGKETPTYSFKLPESIRNHAPLIDEKLADIKVCDPAVGSGAFPVGMMAEIVKARSHLSPYITDSDRNTYSLKRECIEKSLYGVDIDPGAVEIAKLRLWLSLVVDEEDIKQINPLPNLDYKIVCGNSLLGYPYEPRGLNRIEKLKADFFDEVNPSRKKELRHEIDAALRGFFENTQKSLGYQVTMDFRINFSEVFEQKGGFDVVIGNPPYGADLCADVRHFQSMYNLKTSESAILFLEKGCNLISTSGVLTYIIPKSFTFASNYESARHYTLEYLTHIIDCGKAFENVLLEAIVFQLIKGKVSDTYKSLNLKDNNFILLAKIEKNLVGRYGLLPNGITEAEISIADEITSDCLYLNDLSINRRGTILLSLSQTGTFPVVGGKEIDRFGVRSIRGYIHDDLSGTAAEINANSVLVQGIVAHIENPRAHIKITACVPCTDSWTGTPFFIADNLNQITLADHTFYTPFLIRGILNSSLLNWYAYLFIYGRGIRTLRFDNPVTKRIPLPRVNEESVRVVDFISSCSLSSHNNGKNDRCNFFERLIDSIVYELYLPRAMRMSDAEILRYLADLPELQQTDTIDAKKMATIGRVFEQLSNPCHPVFLAMQKQKTVPSVRIIEGLDK